MTNFEKVQQFIVRANHLRRLAGFENISTSAQMRMVDEEYAEVKEAFHANDKAEMIKELVDLLYVTYTVLDTLGVYGDHAFNLVHENNMNKMAEGARFRTDGKLLKPDGFVKVTREEILQAAYGDTTND